MAYSTEQIQSFQIALEQLVAELSKALDETRQAAQPVTLDQPAVGRVSRIDAIQQQKMTEANRAAQTTRLQLAKAALHRLDQDEFGECFSCGDDIDLERLAVRPESLYCIECQSSRERR